MKRHPDLQPLSREHHYGLSISRKATNEDYLNHWQALYDFITDKDFGHFGVEDDFVITPLTKTLSFQDQESQALIQTLSHQHDELAKLINNPNPTLTDTHALGKLLYTHIRLEERQLFPLAEQQLDTDTLHAVYQASSDQAKFHTKAPDTLVTNEDFVPDTHSIK